MKGYFRLAVLLLAALLVGASGCSTKGEVQTQVLVWNHTPAATSLILKAWDHNGDIVFNDTMAAAPSQAALPVATFTGPVSNYGGKYSFLARAGDTENQEAAAAEGISTWVVHIHTDRIEFEFA